HDSQPRGWQDGDPMALVIHGMGGSHQSPACVRLAPHLLRHGVRVVRIDLRGAGEGVKLARKVYHGGCSEDVRTALAELHHWAPGQKQIRVPTFILSARDDPFVCSKSFHEYPRSETVHLQLAEGGGHLGFLGRDGAGGIRWAERRVADWLLGV